MSLLLLFTPSPTAPALPSVGVASIGLTYRGVDIQEAGFGIFLEIIRGVNEGPNVRGEDTIVPWRPGRTAGNRIDDVLPIVLEGIVSGAAGSPAVEISTFRIKARSVRDLFDQKVTGPLVATLEDGTIQTIQARTSAPVLWDSLSPMVARVNIQLESIDPDWTVV